MWMHSITCHHLKLNMTQNLTATQSEFILKIPIIWRCKNAGTTTQKKIITSYSYSHIIGSHNCLAYIGK